MPINTLYQLAAARQRTPRLLAAADRLLTIPDLFHYWLTGNAVCEFTNATTTQMVDAQTPAMERRAVATAWASGADLPAPIVEPGTILGDVLPARFAKLCGHTGDCARFA